MPFDLKPLQLGCLYTRPELAALWGYASYEALARGVFTPRGSGAIVLFVTRQKQTGLTAYKDALSGELLTWEGEAKHKSDRRIWTSKDNGESVYLFYREVHHTPFRYYGQVLPAHFTERLDEPSQFKFRLLHEMSAFADLRQHSDELSVLESTEREQVTKSRIGQGVFRERLLSVWKGCAVTGVERPDLVRASHIKPWRMSSNEERLDPNNGLLLLPQYDHLFDGGYISFDDDGGLLESPVLADISPSLLGFDCGARLRRITDAHREYLDFHRRRLFLRSA